MCLSELKLTSRERQILQRQLVEALDARILRRTLAVSEVAQGRPVREIAKMLGVTRQNIYNWIGTYRPMRDAEILGQIQAATGEGTLWGRRFLLGDEYFGPLCLQNDSAKGDDLADVERRHSPLQKEEIHEPLLSP